MHRSEARVLRAADLEKDQLIRLKSLSTPWQNHTTELVVYSLSSVNSGKNSAIKQELHHNFLAIATE